jgi:3-hydroxyacyl-CoA dehydrogenase
MNVDDISKIGVIGAGLMGHGIALNFALGGYDVYLNDTTDESLEKALESVGTSLETMLNVGLADEASAVAVPGRIHTSTSMEETVADVDFVVEAVFEDMDVKHEVFARLDELSPERTILSSNTSSFMSSQLAPATKRPDKVVVANWWNPPYLLPLVEIVRGPQTSDHTIDTTAGLFTKLGKQPVVLQKESVGFIGNRIQFALLREAISVVEQGIATAEDVDLVVTSSFGRRLAVAGPFEVFDLAGWDTISHIIDQLFPLIESSPDSPALIKDKVDKGEFGVKSGKGFYNWSDDAVAELRGRVGRALAAIDRLSREG